MVIFFDKCILCSYKINDLLSMIFLLIYFNFLKKTINFLKIIILYEIIIYLMCY